MSKKTNNKLLVSRLQQNLAPIRKLAGWTAEELGRRIDVTKQTISNLENNKTPMSLAQYTLIRLVIEKEIEDTPNNIVLSNAVAILLDSDFDEDDKQYEEAREKIVALSTAAATGTSSAVLGSLFLGAGIAGAVAMATAPALIAGVVVSAPWVKKILDSEKK